MFADVVFQRVSELLFRLHAMDIAKQTLTSEEYLRFGVSRPDCRGTELDRISGDRFVTSRYVKGWAERLKSFLDVRSRWYRLPVLGCRRERGFDSFLGSVTETCLKLVVSLY